MTQTYSTTDIQPIPPKAFGRGTVKDITDKNFNGLIVIGFFGFRQGVKARTTRWLVRCVCGTLFPVDKSNLQSGHTTSCGCYLKNRRPDNYRHGMSKNPEYYIFDSMHSRCKNPNNKSFPDYGGRGITVCDEWKIFDTFFADMGLRPSPQHTLERKDVDGNYDPSNCIWATRTEQANNRRSNHLVSYNGKTQTLAQWSKELGFHRSILGDRLRKGWSVDKAFSTPVMSHSDAAKIALHNRWGSPL